MNLSQILMVLRARWRSAALVMLLVVGSAALLTAIMPRQYSATASVLLDVKSSDPIAGSSMQALAISGYMATQADVLVSERVIEGALRDLKIDKDPKTIARWQAATNGQGDFMNWLYEQTLKHFEVLPSRESNVITISYTDVDPQQSAALVNAIVKSYVATTIELRAEPAKQYNAFFDDRAKELRAALEQAQTRLSTFQRDAGVLVNDERLDVENSRLNELSSQLVTAQAAATESGSRKREGAANPESSQEVLQSPVIASITADLTRQQAQLAQLQTTLGDRNPAVETARANVLEMQTRLKNETAKVQTSLAMNASVYSQKAGELRGSLEAQRAKVLHLKEQRDQAAVLQRDVDNANQAYSAAYSRVGQANMESQSTQTNVSTLRVATVPGAPSRPRVFVNLAVAAAMGLLLAVAVVIVREQRDPRLRSEDDVPALLQQQLFGVLPRGTPPKQREKRELGFSAAARRLIDHERAPRGA
ncbi:MAG TPA: chain length determinant protein EpsF [Burkholderiaceae bacterium]|jgi:chain length determinant protein EpsF